MPSYIVLADYTDQGIRNVKDSPKRADAFEAAVKANGGALKDLYLVLGDHDLVAVVELPNDETAAKLALATASLGNVRTTTMRAFNRDEFRKIIASLP
ncbi:MAG: GYD domain-containing protein [Candidatus Rokubacteria bacterium]|nr:GYD domain-containing protein [Candidatus Rokubacteria bacterium]